MSNFYKDISTYYDKIFPANKKIIDFLLHAGRFGKDFLDIACGSGRVAAELKDYGKSIVAIDIEEEMVNKAKEKGLDARLMDMQKLDFDRKFDLIYCIGNSLSHLPSVRDLDDFLLQIPSLLNKGGHLVIQIVNYKNLWNEDAKDGEFLGNLPTIENDQLKFERNYYKAGERIRFNTKLYVDDKVYENNQYLIPLNPADLINYMLGLGFDVKIYGGFDKTIEFEEDKSFHFILKASKR